LLADPEADWSEFEVLPLSFADFLHAVPKGQALSGPDIEARTTLGQLKVKGFSPIGSVPARVALSFILVSPIQNTFRNYEIEAD
jgi:hypothetical protein